MGGGEARPAPRRLPTFIIVGAGKSGTTSLYYYLGQHPEVFLSKVKEPRFFCVCSEEGNAIDTSAFARGEFSVTTSWDSYLSLFAGAEGHRAIGEASIQYMETPGAAQRILAAIPDVSFVALLRDPVDRMHSMYRQRRRDGLERRGFEELLDDGEDLDLYLRGGRYGSNLEPFVRRVGHDRVLALDYDAFGARPRETLRRVFGFLGVDPECPVDVSLRANVSGSGDSSRLFRTFQKIRASKIKPVLDRTVPHRVRMTLIRWMSALADSDEVSEVPQNVRRDLESYYSSEVARLRAILPTFEAAWMGRYLARVGQDPR